MEEKEKEYLQTHHTILLVASMVRDLPLRDFIQASDRSLTIGPILHPSLWIKAHENLELLKEMAQKLLDFQVAASKLEDKVSP